MPYGLPSTIPFTRTEWGLDYLTGDPIEIPAGAVIMPKHRLADQDGWNGEWLCESRGGKQLAICHEKLERLAP